MARHPHLLRREPRLEDEAPPHVGWVLDERQGEAALGLCIERAQVARAASDPPKGVALEAAALLEKEGISAAVLDPRTLVPLDKESIFESVEETNRALIVEEGCKTGGVGGEIAALIADEAFDYLDAPVRRVAAANTPVPFNQNLEKFVFPDRENIVEAVRDLMTY